MDKKLNVYFPVPEYYGPSLHYTKQKLMYYGKDFAIETKDWLSADLLILQLIGHPGRSNLVCQQEHGFSDDLFAIYDLMDSIDMKVITIPLCNIKPSEFYAKLFSKSLFTWSYLDVYPYMEVQKTNLDSLEPHMAHFMSRGIHKMVRSPLGVDPGNFYIEDDAKKKFLIYCFGFDEKTESIDLVYEAIRKLDSPIKMLHSGRKLNYDPKYYQFVEPARFGDWDQVRHRYNLSYFANGLRRDAVLEGGFEMCNIEAPLCNCIPITYDFDCYKHWFGSENNEGKSISKFVDYEKTVDDLCEIFSEVIENKVDKDEHKKWLLHSQEMIYNKFMWYEVGANFWKEVIGNLKGVK